MTSLSVDVHSHLLPGIDDGCQSLAQSQRLLQHLAAQGMRCLALTPHYFSYEQSVSSFLRRREKAMQSLLSLPEAAAFRFILGAEVYFTRGLFQCEDMSSLCYEGTDRMLIELETDSDRMTSGVLHRLERLVTEFEITPVLAHAERYPYLLDATLLRELREMGCFVQVNLSSFAPFFLRRKLLSLTKKGLVDFLGEDIHRAVCDQAKKESLLRNIERKDPAFLRASQENAVRTFFS